MCCEFHILWKSGCPRRRESFSNGALAKFFVLTVSTSMAIWKLVMNDGSQAPDYCHHTIWIERQFVEPVSCEPPAS